jgi:hypothetical protein
VFLREPPNRLLSKAFFALLNIAVANNQPAVARSAAVYHPNQAIHPAALMSLQNFGVWAGSQPLIVRGEQSGLLTRTATTEGASLRACG